jgi:hypothetical protein
LNLIRQSAFVLEPLVSYLAKLVKADEAVGLDESSCRMLLPPEFTEEESQRNPEIARSLRIFLK